MTSSYKYEIKNGSGIKIKCIKVKVQNIIRMLIILQNTKKSEGNRSRRKNIAICRINTII